MSEKLLRSLLISFGLCLFFAGFVSKAFAQAEFVRNEGQWETPYHFSSKLRHGDFWVGSGRAAFILSDFGFTGETSGIGNKHPHGNPSAAKFHAYEMEFCGSDPSPVEGTDKLKRYHNYYTSKYSRNWRSGVSLYSGTIQKNLYQGINLLWKDEAGSLKYEFHLAAGANPHHIRIRYKGIDAMAIEQGELILKTSLGIIRERAPIAWQIDRSGNKRIVYCRFKINSDGTSRFEFPDGYDETRPLVIDPILVFSSFSGSRSDNWGFTSTYGEENSPYAAGIAIGTRFPVSNGAFGASFSGDSTGFAVYSTYDIGILKFNPSGTDLLYASYLGGSEADAPASIVVDKDSNLIVLGASSSADFPVTANAFDTSYNGGVAVSPYGPGDAIVQYRAGSDIVVSKLSLDGRQLLASTFLGGSANDGLLTLLGLGDSPLIKNYGDSFRGEVISDSLGRIYVASNTSSNDFPTASPVQAQSGGGADAVLAIFNPDLDSLVFSTFHGGSTDDAAYSLQFGKAGDVYLCGGSSSADFPATAGTLRPNFGGVVDGFLSRFRFSPAASVRSTFLGTNRYDQAFFVQTDLKGNVYTFGQTIGTYPVSTGVYSNPGSAQFIHCLSPGLDSTRFSTVFGNGAQNPNISPTAFLVDDCGRIYCSGWGGSTNNLTGYQNGNTFGMPTTPGGGAQTTDGSDFYILVLESNATSMVFGTYFGDNLSVGEHVDGGTSRFDKRGVIYQSVCAGCGGSSTFPTSPGVVSNLNGSTNCNNALFVYDFSKLQARYSSTSAGGCIPLTLKFKSVSVYDQQIKWDFDDGTVLFGNSQDTIVHTFQNVGQYKVKLVAYNPEGCPSKDSTIQFITAQEPVSFQGDTLEFCEASGSYFLPQLPQGDLSYQWEPPLFLSNPQSNPVEVLQPDSSVWYTATIKTSLGCLSSARFLLKNRALEARASADTLKGCVPLSVNFSSLSRFSQRERWIFGPGDSSEVLNPNSVISKTFQTPGAYRIILRAENDTSCAGFDSDTLNIIASGGPALSDTILRYCSEGSFPLQVDTGSAISFQWSPGNLLDDSLSSHPQMLNAGSAVFQLQVSDSNGCRSESKVEVRDGRLKPAFSIDSIPLCAPVFLPVSGLSVNAVQSRYYWGADSLTVNGNSAAQLNFASGGKYRIRLRVFSDTACLAFADTSLDFSLGGPGFSGPEISYHCKGDSVKLEAVRSPGFRYSWPESAIVFSVDSAQAFFLPGDSLGVIVQIRDSLNCPGAGSFLMLRVQPDTALQFFSEFEPCTDRLQYRFSSGAMPGNNYRWTLMDTIYTGKTFMAVFPSRGEYNLQLYAEKGLCRDSVRKSISVNDPPSKLEADFAYALKYSDCQNFPELLIENRSMYADRFVWQWNGRTSFENNPQVFPAGEDSIRLRLFAYNGLCMKEMSKVIPVFSLNPPNLITLQEDEKNDLFRIENLPEGSFLEIRDRWGKLIFRENAYRNDWKPEREGVYFYQLRFPGGGNCKSWIQAVR